VSNLKTTNSYTDVRKGLTLYPSIRICRVNGRIDLGRVERMLRNYESTYHTCLKPLSRASIFHHSYPTLLHQRSYMNHLYSLQTSGSLKSIEFGSGFKRTRLGGVGSQVQILSSRLGSLLHL